VHRLPPIDVLVAGAGPAGCHAARELAGRGWRVVLADRARFPRWKPCAGGITLKARPYLPGPLLALAENRIEGTTVLRSSGRETRLETGLVGWLVHREAFDSANVKLAADTPGVDFREGCAVEGLEQHADRVVVRTSAGLLDARAVVGADGVESVVSRFVRDPRGRRFGHALETEVRPPAGRAIPEMEFDFGAFSGGYGWIFPKAEICSIGGCVVEGRGRDLKKRLQRWQRDRGLNPMRSRGSQIPLGGCFQAMACGRVALAGDAADAVDPVTGEGIAWALRTAHLAAEAIHDLLADGVSLDGHTRRLMREVHLPFRFARRLAELLYRHPGSGFDALFTNRLLCEWFIDVLRGRVSYPGLVVRALLRSTRWPFAYARREPRVFAIR